MTSTEIKNTLLKINSEYSLNTWLDLDDIAVINLKSSSNFYPSKIEGGYKYQYYFDSSHELMFERIVNDETVNSTEYTNIMFVVDFAEIALIMGSTITHPHGSYVNQR